MVPPQEDRLRRRIAASLLSAAASPSLLGKYFSQTVAAVEAAQTLAGETAHNPDRSYAPKTQRRHSGHADVDEAAWKADAHVEGPETRETKGRKAETIETKTIETKTVETKGGKSKTIETETVEIETQTIKATDAKTIEAAQTESIETADTAHAETVETQTVEAADPETIETAEADSRKAAKTKTVETTHAVETADAETVEAAKTGSRETPKAETETRSEIASGRHHQRTRNVAAKLSVRGARLHQQQHDQKQTQDVANTNRTHKKGHARLLQKKRRYTGRPRQRRGWPRRVHQLQ